MKGEAASFILKEGTVISTKAGSNPAWYQNIVYKSEGNIVHIGFLDRYLENLVFPDTSITLKFTSEYYEYLFEGTVLKIAPGEQGSVTVKIKKADERVNVRWFPRFDTHLPLHIKPSWDDDFQYAVIINLSLVGIAFISKCPFDINEESTATVFLPDHSKAQVKGKILRKIARNQFYEYGMIFTEMTEHDSNLLSQYLSSLEEKRSNLQNHFFSNIKNSM